MIRSRGRTCRIRRRKLVGRSVACGGTGRGLMTTKSLQAGEPIIALPERCLLTTGVVLESYLGDYIRKCKPPISPLLALCTFLMVERYTGEESQWKPYLDVLPKSYTCPVFWEDCTMSLLPEPLREKAQEQITSLQELYSSAASFFSSLQSLFQENVENILTYEALRWAWCTVNTRTVYMKHPQRHCFSRELDAYALAPFLDLLNHSTKVQVEAAFNPESKCYEIRTRSSHRRYEQVFICYGPHDNQRLLLEYGFVAGQNPHCTVCIPTDILLQHVPNTDKQKNKKLSLLKENGFLYNLTFGLDGPSWKFLVALRLLCLGAEEFTCWKKVLIGESVSNKNEKKTLEVATKICIQLIEETCTAIEKISHWKSDKLGLEDQLAMVESLRLEDLSILQSSRDILESLKDATD
ncbi:SET domain-containing protein 4 isoform X2 [Pleurodeles waltl]|uniref:SET domain-containing protein 4 isoform X2 n=1 Tax=Pleurodeles waltl TaxID=8319 RepID=UPI0037097CCB